MKRVEEFVDDMWRACASEEIEIYGSKLKFSEVVRKEDLAKLCYWDEIPRYDGLAYDGLGNTGRIVGPNQLPPRVAVSADRLEQIPLHCSDERQIVAIRRQVIKHVAKHAIAERALDVLPELFLPRYGYQLVDSKISDAPDITKERPKNYRPEGPEQPATIYAYDGPEGWLRMGSGKQPNKHLGYTSNRPLSLIERTQLRDGHARRPAVEGDDCLMDKIHPGLGWNR